MWRAGPLLHVIPTANHERLLVKISLRSPSAEAPHLRVDGRQVPGTQTDVAGRCFQFDVSNLGPATTYELQLVAPDGGTLSDPWPLKTHPAPDAEVDHLRILAYTCAGGYDGPPLHGQTIYAVGHARHGRNAATDREERIHDYRRDTGKGDIQALRVAAAAARRRDRHDGTRDDLRGQGRKSPRDQDALIIDAREIEAWQPNPSKA